MTRTCPLPLLHTCLLLPFPNFHSFLCPHFLLLPDCSLPHWVLLVLIPLCLSLVPLLRPWLAPDLFDSSRQENQGSVNINLHSLIIDPIFLIYTQKVGSGMWSWYSHNIFPFSFWVWQQNRSFFRSQKAFKDVKTRPSWGLSHCQSLLLSDHSYIIWRCRPLTKLY